MMFVAIALLLILSPAAQDPKKAEDLFKDALAQAKDSKKKVFLTFGSPG